ncbi:hypothetical protein [Nereida sp. MMG025]|uniref:hypothetical protein n=1 Tax=Nereida sp. MMG025 TaxID=2909981 RepID=UPI001F2A37E2|nr:hypothetical protein [Nereida sp. MMG025]MCF6445508.1 hypothetical protein [Nereida sp. MMG025]
MIRILPLVALLALAACDEASEAADKAARTTAKAAIDEILVTKFPFVPKDQITPYSDCVIDAASSKEIFELSKAAVVGVTESTTILVGNILKRPEAIQCIAQAGLKTAL